MCWVVDEPDLDLITHPIEVEQQILVLGGFCLHESNGRVLKLTSIPSLNRDSWHCRRREPYKSVVKSYGVRSVTLRNTTLAGAKDDHTHAAPDNSAPHGDDAADARVLWVTEDAYGQRHKP